MNAAGHTSTQNSDRRLEQIKSWLETRLNIKNYKIEIASADASFRRYFRLLTEDDSQIIMDAPPDKEDCDSFVKVAKLIESVGVQAPHIFQFNQQGFILLTDLGSTAFLDKLNADTVDSLYSDAIQSIVKMQTIHANLADYDNKLLQFEMSLFKDWYLQKHLQIKLSETHKKILADTFDLLADSALQQQQVFVHRDYHSRNLMITEKNNPGVIDFQDAVNGPASYDLVSLIKDCYISWPRKQQLAWIDQFLQLSDLKINKQHFIKQLDFMGMQRHLKATGIFSRLNYRDAKPAYLNDIPRTLAYVQDVCQRYAELSDFLKMMTSLNIQVDQQVLEAIR